jgi:hypothetical protein
MEKKKFIKTIIIVRRIEFLSIEEQVSDKNLQWQPRLSTEIVVNVFCEFFQFSCNKIFFFDKFFIFSFDMITVKLHNLISYLLKSTILTSVPINSINNTLLISRTLIIHHWTLWASKKSFASLACYDAIVNSRWLITAHFTRDDFDLSWKRKKTIVRLVFNANTRFIRRDSTIGNANSFDSRYGRCTWRSEKNVFAFSTTKLQKREQIKKSSLSTFSLQLALFVLK